MNDLKRDLISLLNYFVERETYEEKEFIADQKNCELKLNLSVSLSNYITKNDQVNLLRIHTKLYQSYQLLDDDVNYDQSSYYIKSQTVSHCTGIVSSNSVDNRKIMSIETVVTKDNCKCETVFKTFVTKSDNDKKKKTQRFFTREIAKCHHLPHGNDAHNRFSVIFSDEEEEIVTPPIETTINNPVLSGKPKLAKRLSWKKIKFNKSTKKFEKQTSVENKKNIENDIQNLQPIKKSKSTFKKIKQLFQTKPRVTNDTRTTLNIDSNKNIPKVPFMRSFSTENEEMEKEKPTNIMATINLTKWTKSFDIIKDDIPFIDEDDDEDEEDDDNCFSLNRSKSNSFTDSLINFNFSVSPDAINATIKKIIEKKPCKCNERLNDFISQNLRLINKDNNLVKKKLDSEPYDKIHKHYLDCEVGKCLKMFLKYNSKYISKSQESIQIPTLLSMCKDIDEHFGDDISSMFLPFLEKINKQNKNDLCSCDEKKKKKITIYLLRLMNAMKENGDFKNTYNWSTKHFKDCLGNFNSLSINPNANILENVIDDLEENEKCNCNKRRKDAMTNTILSQLYKTKTDEEELDKFDDKIRHFIDCPYFKTPVTNSKPTSLLGTVSSVKNINSLDNNAFSRSRSDSIVSLNSGYHSHTGLETMEFRNDPILCDCVNRRFKVLATLLGSVIYQNNLTKNEIDEFNFNSHHFKSCSKKLSSSEFSPSFSFSASPYNENSPVFNNYSPISRVKKSRRKHSVSIDTINYLDQVFQDIKVDNKIECPIETISYFHKCGNYEHYEKGLDKVLDSKPTIENMRLFFYLTRMIIRHIDDPNFDENQEIKEILQYSETFLYERFSKEIIMQNGLEKFILGIDSLD